MLTNDDDTTALHMASEEGLLEVAKLLLAARANPNLTVDVECTTPLYLAASNGQYTCSRPHPLAVAL